MARKTRDSGVEWIGEVPEGWEIAPLKKCFEKTFSGIWGADAGVGEETVTCYRIADFNYAEGIVSTDKLTTRSYKCEELEGKLVRKGDLLLEKSGGGDLNPVGRAVLVNHDFKATCSNFIQALRCNAECDERFVCYMLQTSYSKGVNGLYYNQTIGIQNLQVGKYLSIRLPIPPLPEQRRIADYLDEKCAAIDEAISELKSGIEDFKAWKKALIFEAVTGKQRVGFNAEKQRGREAEKLMRDSDIPWIGEIPEGWEVKRLRYLADITTGNKDTQDANPEGAYPFYVRSPIIERSTDYTFDGPGIMMAGDGAGAGRVFHLADGKYAVHQRVYRLYNFQEVDARFLWRYLMATFPFEMDKGSAQSTVPSVRLPMLLNHCTMLPPLPEQQAIADYLDEKCAAIDALVAEKEKLITDLEAYKKSLIFEVVTGKKEVA